jgi:cellulose synthase/poly-beta-1,6-N-acetylglucosamine synthase-like glycosyltransferase
VIFPFLFFAGLLTYFSFRSFLGGVAFLAFFKQQLVNEVSEFKPFATIIAPCKGLDEGLRENLTALLELDYPEYEVIFVVDDQDDPAVSVITEFLGNEQEFKQDEQDSEDGSVTPDSYPVYPVHPVKMIVAGKSTDSSQKVENIREAVRHADPRSQVFVFVDSDARPQKYWLKNLVARLDDESVGVATGYRWFLSKKMTFASELRSAWNASIASALGPKSSFCWAGSMAIRREVWETLDLTARLKGTLSDDFTVTRAVQDAGLEIRLVPQALTPSIENCTFRELFEFTTRQMKITRVYATQLWALSFFGSALFCGVMLSAFLIVILSRSNDLLVWSAIATLTMVSALSIGKARLRLKAVTLVIPAASEQFVPQLTLWLLAPPLFLWNCVAALLSRTINWRGIRYRLVSPTETHRLDPS